MKERKNGGNVEDERKVFLENGNRKYLKKDAKE